MPRASKGAVVALAALLLSAQGAGARAFQMSGRWTQDRGTVLGLDLPPIPASVPGAGVVTATGSAPARLTVKPGRFSEMGGGVLQALPAPFVQLSTGADAQGPVASAMFAPGPKPSRPASFTWAIPAPGNSNVASVRYRAGPNQFGGTARLLVFGGASVSHMVFTTGGVGWITSRVAHEPFAFGDAFGGAYAAMATRMLPAYDITQQPGFAMGPITMPGPVIAMGPAQALVSTGFPWTTGQVRLFVNGYAPGDPSSTATLTGLDARTPMGAGNIVMVAGGLVRRDFFGRDQVLLQSGVLDITLEPLDVPALSHAAYAALALSLLAAGYALRRRL